jgi:hypothetical protein
MSLQTLKQHLEAALADVDALLAPSAPTYTVRQGDNLLSVLEQAPAGATVYVEPTFIGDVGSVTLPKPVTLRTTAALAGSRATSSLVGPTLRGALTFQPDTTCVGLWFDGTGGTIVKAAHRTVLDQCVLMGATNGQQRGVLANDAEDVVVTRTHIGGIWKDIDTQAVGFARGTKRLQIIDSYLEASGENVLAGGDRCPSVDLIPQDILIENCTLAKPLAWKEKPGCTSKNLLEIKNAKRVTVRNCDLEYSWADGQTGYAILLHVRDQYGDSPWSVVEDVLVENCAIRHVGGAFSLLGRDDIHTSDVMKRVTIRHCTAEDISRAWAQTGAVAYGRPLFITGGPQDVTVEDCDFAQSPGVINAALAFDQLQYPVERLAMRRCRLPEGSYGIVGRVPTASLGAAQIAGHAPGYVWEDMTIVRGTSGRTIAYPAGTTLV